MGNLHKRKGTKWWRYQWRDAAGRLRTRTMKGITDVKVAKLVAAKIESETGMERMGLIDPKEKKLRNAGRAPISTHIEAWAKKITAANTPQYAKEESAIVSRVFAFGNITTLEDISPGPVKTAIDTVPRLRGKGTLSARQKNKALTACKMFCQQMMRDSKLRLNPLLDVSGWNEAVDQRHQRIATEQEDFIAILKVARSSNTVIEGLNGPQRAMLYQLAAGTGFRKRTLLELTPSHFHLTAIPPFIRVLPTNVKNKKPKDQPLRMELAEAAKAFIAGMKPSEILFPATGRRDTAEMIRRDSALAGLEYQLGDSHFRDFHSLRHTFGTEIGKVTNIKVVKELMGHSTVVLSARYMNPTISDFQNAVENLPSHEPKKGKKNQSTG